MNLAALFAPSLESSESGGGLEFAGAEYSFGDLEGSSNRIAHMLLASGHVPGDCVAVYLKNSVELIEIYLACVKLGLVFVPINVLYRAPEVEHIVRDAEPKTLITGRDVEGEARASVRNLPQVNLDLADDLHASASGWGAERPKSQATGDSAAAIVYTSGTTGRAKGVVLTQNNFAANTRNLIDCWRINAEDRLLLPLPLFHVHGLGNGLHTWLAAGFRMRLLERFRKQTAVQEFLDFQPTVFFGVPTMYERLLEVEPKVARRIGQSMRLFVSGSAPLPAATLARFESLYGHVILERYGMTETLMITSNPFGGERRAGSVGVPLPGVTLRLADSQTGAEVAAGEMGEVTVKGANVFRGYWRQPEASAEAFTREGFFRTGDLAVRSADGYYTLAGRKHDLIICGGFNVYPREIEEVLNQQPEIAESAVCGVPDRVRGEVPVAYVVLQANQALNPDALLRRCRDRVASFKVPRRFIVVEKLPRNALGKVQRHLLPDVPRSSDDPHS